MSNAAPSDVYAEQLFQCRQGLPLWAPEPTKHGEILVGDVGYLDDGAFYRLFNATRSADDEINRKYGVPDGFEPFPLNEYGLNVREAAVPKGPLCSRSVSSSTASAKAGAHGVAAAFNLECKEQHGAFLVLKEPADREELQKNTRIPEYMLRYHASWQTFAREKCDMDLDKDEIILVRGWVKTKEWAVGAFTHGKCSLEVTLSADVASQATVSFSFRHTQENNTPYFGRTGPPRAINEGHQESERKNKKGKNKKLDKEMATHDPLKRDQCVFLHYYKIKPRILFAPKVIKAAAGPPDLRRTWDDSDHAGNSVTAHGPEVSGDEFVIEQIPAPRKAYDPVDFVLDYILENSNADIAFASDQDVLDACDEENIGPKISKFLATSRPHVAIDNNGIGTLSFDADTLENMEKSNRVLARGILPSLEDSLGMSSSSRTSIATPRLQRRDNVDRVRFRRKVAVTNTHPVVVVANGISGVSSLAYSPDGRYFAIGTDDSRVIIWSASTGEVVSECLQHRDLVCGIDFSPNGRHLVSGSRDRLAIIWEVATGEPSAILEGHSGSIESVAYSPDGRMIATSSYDFTIRLWDAINGSAQAVLRGHGAIALLVAFSPDSSQVASASVDCTARLWDASTGECLSVLQGRMGAIYSLSFSRDGRRIVTASDNGSIVVWSAISGVELLALQLHQGAVWQAVFSPDGKRILSVASDKMVKVYESFSGKQLLDFETGNILLIAAAFSNDAGRACVSSEDNLIRLWDTGTGKCLATLQGHEDNVTHLRFSPDGQRLLACEKGAVRLWNLEELPAT